MPRNITAVRDRDTPTRRHATGPVATAGRCRRRRRGLDVLLAGVLALAACADPAQRYTAHATRAALVHEDIPGAGFRHTVYHAGDDLTAARTLHVYLDGDGLPWQTLTSVARDPTARDPLVLDLMRQDPMPAILLGRPCYARVTPDPACTPWHWTHGRYSEAVVASLAAAAGVLLARAPRAEITLIGYSGGGALAVLLAPRLPRVVHVMTLAANLDVAAWASRHRYSPLAGSLDPATQPPLPAHLRQTYLFGAQDTQVPREFATHYLARVPSATVEELPAVDHRCCWRALWPTLLARHVAPR